MHVLLCHSVLGLRDVEREVADVLGSRGHAVSLPDLFAGATAGSIEEGAEIVARLGWASVCETARSALRELPADTVLGGLSMGVGVASELWPRRPSAAGAIFLHALPTVPPDVRRGFAFEVHVGEDDHVFAGTEAIESLRDTARAQGSRADVFRYPGAGHFFTDREDAVFDEGATGLVWDRVCAFLSRLAREG